MGSYQADRHVVIPYKGRAGEVRLYSRALSDVEVLDTMFRPLDVALDGVGLEGYYKLNDGVFGYSSTVNREYPAWGDSTLAPKYASYNEERCLFRDAPATYNERWHGKFSGPSPEQFVIDEKRFEVKDSSAHGRHGHWGGVGTVAYMYGPLPTSATCPAHITNNVVHVDGGVWVNVTGSMFAKSEFLKCAARDVSVPARWHSERNVSCHVDAREDACAVPLE
eukprot:3855561-Pyramimonas_sp.AAC.1